MIRRVEREPQQPVRKLGLARRAATLIPVEETRDPQLALQYSNGFVTVEITYDAYDRYVDTYGDVPLPVRQDQETGDKRVWDNKNKVKVIYDREMHLREITSRTREGLHVRVNFPNGPTAEQAGAA